MNGPNMEELESAIQRDLEKQKQENKIIRELAEPIASEAMELLQMCGLEMI